MSDASNELWVIRGREPVLWTVPFYVDFLNKKDATMYHAVPLMAKQELAVRHVLQSIAEKHDGLWKITRVALEKIGEPKSMGGDPLQYFSWERQRAAQVSYNPERRQERDDFLDALYQKGVGQSRDEVEYWWHTFANHSLDWLLNKEKPVDFYFIRLHNCPYRANWRETLLGRFPKLGWLLRENTGKDRDIILNKSGMVEEMHSLDLLAMNPNTDTCYRHIEVEHRPSWWKQMLRVERVRMQTLGSAGYGTYFLGSVRRWLRGAATLYMEYLAGVDRPTAADVESGYAGECRLIPNFRLEDRRGKSRQAVEVPIVIPIRPPRYVPPSKPERLYPKADVLQDSMPAIQPRVEDVRDTRTDLHLPQKWIDRSTRLLVLDAVKEPNGVQLLGPQSEPGQGGMANGAEQQPNHNNP